MSAEKEADWVYGSGAYRIASYDPTLLPLLPAYDQSPPSRFDDPEREFRVRYVARSLRGCFIEAMAQWRPSSSEIVARAKAVKRSPRDITPAWETPQVPRAWLEKQFKVRLRAVRRNDVLYVPAVLPLLATDENVAAEVTVQLGSDYHLDEAAVMLSGVRGRRISQAIARAVYDDRPRPDGISFRSRFDVTEDCCALFGDTAVEWLSSPELLRASCEEDRSAAVSAAERHGLKVPDGWT